MPIKQRTDCQFYHFDYCDKKISSTHQYKCIGMTCKAYKTKFIKLIATCEGDRSVGIWGDLSEILIERRFVELEYGYTEENRKWIKEQFQALFRELFDDPSTRCQFEDECYGCGKLKAECSCPKEI